MVGYIKEVMEKVLAVVLLRVFFVGSLEPHSTLINHDKQNTIPTHLIFLT
jgi:hypothetical protein